MIMIGQVTVAAAQGAPVIDGVAYAHVTLTITFDAGELDSIELAGGIYPRARIDSFCIGGACKMGVATPFGYGYHAPYFEEHPYFHAEEIAHIRQWEALGPAFLLAYAVTGGEPFEPYPTRDSVIASAREDVPYWDMDRMWRPPPELERAYPQLRVRWSRSGETKLTFLPGYAELLQAALGRTGADDPHGEQAVRAIQRGDGR